MFVGGGVSPKVATGQELQGAGAGTALAGLTRVRALPCAGRGGGMTPTGPLRPKKTGWTASRVLQGLKATGVRR